MPSLILGGTHVVVKLHPGSDDGRGYAENAIEFAAMGLLCRTSKIGWPTYHVFALAIELAFKSVALRSGATHAQCKKAGHRISEMFKLLKDSKVRISARIEQRLNNDEWFKGFVEARYPTSKTIVFLHPDYPEMIAEILETPCDSPLGFFGGSAMEEIRLTAEKIRRQETKPVRMMR